jgi:hypothetical protein
VLCGRILLFLAYVFPLSERSGVNPSAVFHVSNVTPYESENPVAGKAAGAWRSQPLCVLRRKQGGEGKGIVWGNGHLCSPVRLSRGGL